MELVVVDMKFCTIKFYDKGKLNCLATIHFCGSITIIYILIIIAFSGLRPSWLQAIFAESQEQYMVVGRSIPKL